jgi:hypothetical protein
MKAYLVWRWMDGQRSLHADADLIPGLLRQQDDKYYFVRDSDNLVCTINPPDGVVTWENNIAAYQLATLTDKGLVYNVTPPTGGVYSYLVLIAR